MTEIASLVVSLGADIGDLTRGLNTADKKVNNFIGGMGRDLQGIGRSVAGLGTQFSLLSAPIGAAMYAGISIAAEFSDSLAELSARTGLTGDALLEARDAALKFGADTSFSAQESIQGMVQLASSGWSVHDAIVGLPGIMNAASAGAVGLSYASDAITNVMSAFGLVNPADAQRVADALIKASGASSADFTGLVEGIGNVGGVAAQYGLTIEDTAAALAVFADAGIAGSEAGTQLKSMLMKLGSPEAAKAMQELGTSFYDLEGNARPLDSVIDDLKVSLDKLPVSEQNRLMQELAGSYGVVGLSALLSAGGIDTMEGKMDASAGAADVAAARMNTFSGKMDALKGSVETLAIKALTPLMDDVLSPLAEKFTDVINSVIKWTDENPALTSTIVGIAAAALTIGPALIVAGIGIQAAGVAIGALGLAVGLLTSPLILATAAVVGLGLGIAYLWSQDIGGIKTKVTDLADSIKGADISGAATDFQTQLAGLFDLGSVSVDTNAVTTWANENIDSILGTVVSLAGIAFGGPVGATIGIASLLSKAIASDFGGIGTFLKDSGIKASVETAFNDLKTDIGSIISTIFGGGGNEPILTRDMIERGLGGSQGSTLSGPFQTFLDDLKHGAEWLSGELPTIVGPITDALSTLGPNIKEFLGNLSGTETEGLLRIATVIGGALGAILTKVVEFGAQFVGDAITNIGNALPQIGSLINDVVSALSRLGQGDWGGVAQKLADGIGHLVSAGLNLMGIDVDFSNWDTTFQGWVTAFQNAWAGIQFIADGIKRTMQGFFLDLQIKFGEWVSDLRQKILDVTSVLGEGHQLDIAPNIDLQLNTLREQRGGFDIADQIYKDLAADLTAGSIDLSPELAGAIAWNPEAIAAGMSQSGRQAVQDALVMALSSENEAAYNVLLPLATELGINIDDLKTQMQTGVTAAAALDYSANVTVAVNLNPTFPNLTAFGQTVSGAMQSAAGISANVQSPIAVPAFADGGLMQHTGYAFLHAGEAVLTPPQTREYLNGSGGGNSISVSINGVQDVDGLLYELRRQGVDLLELARR